MSLIDDFLEYKKRSKNSKKGTLDIYRSDIEGFYSFIKKNLLEVDRKDIDSYVEFLKPSYKNSSITRKITTLKGFYKYLLKKGKINSLPVDNIKLEKTSEEIFETLEQEEIEKILEVLSKDRDDEKIGLLIRLLIETNFSISTLLKIKISDLELSSCRYITNIEDGKEVYLPSDLEDELKTSIKENKEENKKEENKIKEDKNKKEENKKGIEIENSDNLLFNGLSRQLFRVKFINLGVRAGIERKITPNMLRQNSKAKIEIEKKESSHLIDSKIREKYFKIGIGDD